MEVEQRGHIGDVEQIDFLAPIITEVEKVRVKDLLYLIFGFDEKGCKLEIKNVCINPSKHDKFMVKKEEQLREQFDRFKKLITEIECCYAVFDFEANLEGGSPRSVLFFVICIPDSLNVKKKFLYSSNVKKIREHLKVFVKPVQINHPEDLTYEGLKSLCLSIKKG